MRPLGVGVVAAALAAAIAVPPAYAAHPSDAPVPCQVFDLSPNFAHDGTAFCLSRHQPLPQDIPNGVDAFLSTDRGHTWKQVAATGLPSSATSIWTHVLFSADYPHDHTIYVQESTSGLFKTTDGGTT
ncbi:MAG: hypothetical protein JO079_09515, partial [Frankiaceae bacterium]|nr:hypothetical protein [Frankiaceae bacterium]